MTPPAIIKAGQSVGHGVSAQKGIGKSPELSTDVIIGKLRGANPAEVEKALDYIKQNKETNPRLIQPLLILISSANDPTILGKALAALVLIRESHVFNLDQQAVYDRQFGSAQTQLTDKGLEISGKGFSLPGGLTLDDGSIYFKDNEWFVAPGSFAVINGLEIKPEHDYKIILLFKDKEYNGKDSFLAINLTERTIRSGSIQRLTFLPGNPFLEVEETDYLVIRPGFNTKVAVDHRKGERIPLVSVLAGNRGVDLQFSNGTTRLIVDQNIAPEAWHRKIHHEKPATSVPLQLEVFLTRKDFIEKRATFLFDNNNNYFIPERNAEVKEFSVPSEAEDFSNSPHFNQNGLRASQIKNWSMQGGSTVNAYRIRQMLDNLPPGLQPGIERLLVTDSDDTLKAACNTQNNIGGCARKSDKKVAIKHDTSFSTLYHEAAHIWTYKIEEEEENAPAMTKLRDYQKGLKEKYQSDFLPRLFFVSDDGQRFAHSPNIGLSFSHIDWEKTMTEEEQANLIRLTQEASTERKKSFSARWRKIAGKVYGRDIMPASKPGELSTQWADGHSGSRHGCKRAYGCNNFYEDVATFVEPFAEEDYNFFIWLNNPENPGYDPRYKQKIGLLLEYGFITQKQYNRVFPPVASVD